MMNQIKAVLENKAGWYEAVKGDTYNVWYGTGVLAVRVFCGEEFELIADVLFHIVNEHMDDELPDVDPAGEDVGCVD